MQIKCNLQTITSITTTSGTSMKTLRVWYGIIRGKLSLLPRSWASSQAALSATATEERRGQRYGHAKFAERQVHDGRSARHRRGYPGKLSFPNSTGGRLNPPRNRGNGSFRRNTWYRRASCAI